MKKIQLLIPIAVSILAFLRKYILIYYEVLCFIDQVIFCMFYNNNKNTSMLRPSMIVIFLTRIFSIKFLYFNRFPTYNISLSDDFENMRVNVHKLSINESVTIEYT